MSKPKPTLVVLAAGASSRMKKSLDAIRLTQSQVRSSEQTHVQQLPASNTHKGLIPLDQNGKTAIDLLIDQAAEAGIERVIMIIQPPGNAFKEHFASKDRDRVNDGVFPQAAKQNTSVDFAYQNIPPGRVKPMGTADAIQQCMLQFPELHQQEFLVCNADNLYSSQAFRALINVESENALIGYDRDFLDFPLDKIRSFALLVSDQNQCMTELTEKPDQETTQRLIAQGQQLNVSMNLWKFYGAALWAALEDCPIHPERQEKELPTAVRLMIDQHKANIKVVQRKEHVPDLTQASDIEAVRHFLQRQASNSSQD